MSFTFPSFAKINLLLRVLGKRADGFHELFTVFQTVSLHDEITFAESDDISLRCSDKRIPTNGKNLIVKAAEMLREHTGIKSGAQIHLEKRIPSPGGLGGGSSNAAAALIGLCRLWDVSFEIGDLLPIASELGSDVPFFLTGGTAIGRGRGTEIESVEDVGEVYLLIVSPRVSVSTAAVYTGLRAEDLTNEASNRILPVCRFDRDLNKAVLVNDLEVSVFGSFPEIERVKRTLYDLGASQSLMSGSGASVFGIFDKEKTRQAALKALDNEVNWRKFAVTTVSRNEYRERMYRKL